MQQLDEMWQNEASKARRDILVLKIKYQNVVVYRERIIIEFKSQFLSESFHLYYQDNYYRGAIRGLKCLMFPCCSSVPKLILHLHVILNGMQVMTLMRSCAIIKLPSSSLLEILIMSPTFLQQKISLRRRNVFYIKKTHNNQIYIRTTNIKQLHIIKTLHVLSKKKESSISSIHICPNI